MCKIENREKRKLNTLFQKLIACDQVENNRVHGLIICCTAEDIQCASRERRHHVIITRNHGCQLGERMKSSNTTVWPQKKVI